MEEVGGDGDREGDGEGDGFFSLWAFAIREGGQGIWGNGKVRLFLVDNSWCNAGVLLAVVPAAAVAVGFAVVLVAAVPAAAL